MTRDDVIRMAREAGFAASWSVAAGEALERFAALVAAAEREACVGVIKNECLGFAQDDEQLNRIIAAIRARREKND